MADLRSMSTGNASAPDLRAVLAGCGAMSREWLKAVKAVDGIELVGFVDLHEEAAARRAAESGAFQPVIGTDLESVLQTTKPDLVFDCTIPEAHHDVALTAFAHGCHVLGEKPLAHTMEHARVMVDAARAADRIHAIIQNYRHQESIRRLRHFIGRGPFGDLTAMHADFFLGPHFGGFRESMRHVLLLDMAIHTFDAARFLSGEDALAVYCHETNPRGSWYAHGASATAIFEMTNGVTFTYRGSWCAEGLGTGWGADWRIIGTNGSARWNGAKEASAEIVAETAGFLSRMTAVDCLADEPGPHTDGHTSLVREFADCVREGRRPETVSSDNIKSLAMVFAAIESAETGMRVEIHRSHP